MTEPAHSWSDRLLLFPVRRPALTLLAALLLLAAAVGSASTLDFNPRLEAMLPSDAPSTTALRQLTNDFRLLDQALLLVEHPRGSAAVTSDEEESTAQLLAFAERFERQVRADAEASRLVEAIEFRAPKEMRRFIEEVAVPSAIWYLNDSALGELLGRLTLESMRDQMVRNEELIATASPAASELSKQILRDPLRLHEIIAPALASMRPALRTWRDGDAYLSPDGGALLIRVEAAGSPTDMAFTKQLMGALRRAAEVAAPGELIVHYGGGYAIAEASEKGIRGDMIGSVTGSIILLQLLYLFAYRRFSSFALIISPVAWGVVIAFGIYALFFGSVSPVSAGIGAMLAGMGDDFSIHYLSHFESCRRRGLSIEQSADLRQGFGMSLAHACGTSMVGFLAIGLSMVPALREFALLGALGLGGALVGTVTVLPAILALLDRRRTSTDRASLRFVPVMIERFQNSGRAWRTGAILFAAAAVVLIVRWNSAPWFGTEVHAMHPQPNEPLKTQHRVAKRFGVSPETMFIHLQASTPADLIAVASQVQARMNQPDLRDGIAGSIGPATFLPDAARRADRQLQLHRASSRPTLDAAANFRSALLDSSFHPAAFAKYEEYLSGILKPSPPPGLLALAKYPAVARLVLPASTSATASPPFQALVTLHLRSTPRDTIERDQLVDAVRASIADVNGATLTGLSVIGREMEHVVRRELPRMSLVALAVVLIWVMLIFRRPVDVLIAMAPAAAAGLFMLAALRLAGDGLTMVNMAAIPILFGIAIDNGIFLVGAVPRAGAPDHAAVASHLAERCHAISVSTLTTILAFGALVFASVPALASLGLALTAGMIGCWLASVFLVIPLLVRRVAAASAAPDDRESAC